MSTAVRFHKDLELASSMVTEDYLAKHIRKRPLYSEIPVRPPLSESPFGRFPVEYKKRDAYDGNVNNRLERVSPPRMPRVRATEKAVRVYIGADGGTGCPVVKGDVTGVVQAKLRTAQACTSTRVRPSSAQPRSISVTSGTKSLHPSTTKARPKSAPPRRQTEQQKMGVLERLERFMKHQGKFAVPPSHDIQDYAGNKFRKSMKSVRKAARAPVAGAYRVRPLQATLFRQYYDRADLPISVLHRAGGNRLKWQVKPADLDYHAYLPLFFDGLREIDDPYRFMAMQGILDMVEACPTKVLPCVPQVILPLKMALDTREPTIMCGALKILQHLIFADPQVGQALVPYYRQLLPVFNLFKDRNENRGDGIDYNQRRRLCVGDLITETLELLELTGGPDAYINIKYMIPTYESALIF